MGYQALYRAWRPDCFEDVVGQEPIVTTLVHQIETGRIAHAYLFCGSRGTGKTTTAKVLARAINCARPLPGARPCGTCEACVALQNENNMDVMEIDAASNNGVDEVRALRAAIVYPPAVGRYKVYIIDEVHMLSTGAFNALLKTLEEPPAHAVFILATTEPQKLPATILSRCQRFDFRRIAARVIVERLHVVLRGVGREADAEALEMIARAAEGGMRDAISLMDMCLSYGEGTLTAKLVRDVLGASDRSFLFAFAGALLAGDAAAALLSIDQIVREGRDPSVFLKEVVSHLRALLLSQLVDKELCDLLESTEEDARRYCEQAKGASRDGLMHKMNLFIAAEADMKWASQPRAVLELTAVRACHPEREQGGDLALLERIDKLEGLIRSGDIPDAPEKKARKADDKADGKAEVKRVEKPGKLAPPAVREDTKKAQDWKKTLEIIERDNKSTYPLVAQAVFAGVEGDVASIVIPKKWKMYYTVLETAAKKQLVEEALSQAFGRPMRLRASIEGTAQAAMPAESRQTLSLAFEAFGRENVVISDD